MEQRQVKTALLVFMEIHLYYLIMLKKKDIDLLAGMMIMALNTKVEPIHTTRI